MNNPSYVYASSEEETKRLNKQSDLIKESAIEHLHKAGLRTGLRVVDMGCGSGAMTTYLAEQVGPTGHVYAIDIDDKQLEATRKALADKNLTNVTFIRCDITSENPEELNDIIDCIDIVYMRFVLMHLKRPDIAVKNLRRVLKEKGRVASQESLLESTHCEPIDSPEIRRSYAHTIELAKKLGTDKNIGGKLLELFTAAGFTPQIYYKVEHRLVMREAVPVMLQSLDSIHKSLILEHKITTEEEIENYKSVLISLAEKNDRSLVFDQGYIVAMC